MKMDVYTREAAKMYSVRLGEVTLAMRKLAKTAMLKRMYGGGNHARHTERD